MTDAEHAFLLLAGPMCTRPAGFVYASALAAGEFYGCSINYNDAVFEIFRRRTGPAAH